MQGKVYIVGAGPGDPELFTIKGKRCLEEAEVVVYDRLASEELLQYAIHEAEFLYVGKQPDAHTLTQEEINQLLVKKAKEGKLVTRLKGGDPFVFGRGGEEANALRDEGISFEVVPGITSAISAPLYAGIPVTHRHVSSSFSVITGHEDPTKTASSINWGKLAKATDTLCFLMGVGNLSVIVDKLITHGRDPNTPVALIRWGTTTRQTTLTGKLTDIVTKVEESNFKPPAVIVVGEVVNLRDKLTWFEHKPLFNQRIVVTRARSQASDLSRQIYELGGEPIEFPTIEICPPASYEELDTAINYINAYHWLIFTSVNGVTTFFDRLAYLGRDIRDLQGIKLCAIGKKTAEQLSDRGLLVDFVPDKFQAEALIDGLADKVTEGDKVLIPRAKEAREILPNTLADMGLLVDVVPAYETKKGKGNNEKIKQMFSNGDVDAVTFTSSSTVRNFIEMLNTEDLSTLMSKVHVACIGPITAETCQENGIEVDAVAEEYTIPGLVEVLKDNLG